MEKILSLLLHFFRTNKIYCKHKMEDRVESSWKKYSKILKTSVRLLPLKALICVRPLRNCPKLKVIYADTQMSYQRVPQRKNNSVRQNVCTSTMKQEFWQENTLKQLPVAILVLNENIFN